MTIPTTGTFTSTDVKNEWGYGLPFTSAQVASSAGLSTPWTSENLRGKSAFTAVANPGSMRGSARVLPGDFRPVTALATTTITATPADGVTYTWTHISGIASYAPTSNQCRVSYASRLAGTRTGTVQCVVARGSASVTLTIPYSLTIYGEGDEEI